MGIRGYKLTPEQCLNISRGLTGIKHTKEHNLNMSIANKGKPWSEARKLAQLAVSRRKRGKKSIKLNRGKEYHPNWIEIRKVIYERDGWTCQECGKRCHGNGTKDKIQCHHVDYNIKNNNPKNLITLCASCHCKTNFKKQNWIKYYKLIMERKRKLWQEM